MTIRDPVAGDRGAIVVRLATNSIVQIAGNALASAVGFFTFVAATRGLGPALYGDYVVALAFMFVPVVLADLGISTVVLREISARPERTQDAMSSSLPLRALVSTAAVVLATGIGLNLPFSEDTLVAIVIGAFGAVAALLNLAVVPVLQSQLRMPWAVVANVVGRVVTLALTFAALELDLGIAGVAWANTLGLIGTLLISVVAVTRLISLRPVVDVVEWGRLLRGSVVLGIAIGLSQVYFRVDTLLLAFIRPEVEVGLYGAAYKFLELAELVMFAIILSLFPALSRFIATDDQRLHGLVQRGLDTLLAIGGGLARATAAVAREVVPVTPGGEAAAGNPGPPNLGALAPLAVPKRPFSRALDR